VGREAVKLTGTEYVGIVKTCPLRMTTNQNRVDLPTDFFSDFVCSIIYNKGYRLGSHSKLKKLKDGCRVEVTCFS
jgi:hypothetical protein